MDAEKAKRVIDSTPQAWKDFLKGIDTPASYREYCRAVYFLEGYRSRDEEIKELKDKVSGKP